MRVVISGTVGVGKSTVSNLLVKKLRENKEKVNFLEEEVTESIYLEHYYKNPQEWAFIAQVDFVLSRFKQWLIDEKSRLNGPDFITIYDRHFLDDYIFAELHTIKKNISTINSLTYQTIYNELLGKMRLLNAKPDFFFLLEGNFENVIERLKTRGREEEEEVPMEYWRDLYQNYYVRPVFQNHFAKNTKKVIRIDTNNKTPEIIVNEILKYIQKG